MRLNDVEIGKDYIIEDIDLTDEELKKFLFSLGCYTGEIITLISTNKDRSIICVKDARYSIDKQFSEKIIVSDKINTYNRLNLTKNN